MMNGIYLLLGSNQGERYSNLSLAGEQIIARAGPIEKRSSIYETEAWGKTDQPLFLNQALKILTPLKPAQLLSALQIIEHQLGRERKEKWGPRTIDIDILLYDDLITSDDHLTLPHPGIQHRKFVLIPLSEIAGDFVHPLLNKSINELSISCVDPLNVYLFEL